ncbi:hypothetical protein D9615_001327 [Tricholomella constricta]|uniref:Lipase-like C-terminal domain-containing protein n=1 Tax=Tricholomella constricta TaxID=117010 RepID=A0A8H5M8I6_9AGAR|nr:hypothetical protein D9615_001327 [Tricholomella constricta]
MSSHVPQDEPVPLIIVEGFLGGAGAAWWGQFHRYLNQGCGGFPRRVIFTSVGPVSSLHDRACELYYALRGGTVDYGEDHTTIHGHSRYGRTKPRGLYPQWSRRHPLHFLGHSIGGPTITKLQFLLQQGHFGPSDHPDMILGTQLVYTLGERTDAAPAVRCLSVGSLLSKWVHLVTFLSPLLPRMLDLHAESRSLSYRELSFTSLLKQLWSSDWAESRDATPFDVTFEAADERESNLEGHTHPRTYYRSHVACMAQSSSMMTDFNSAPLLSLCTAPLYLTSQSMAAFDYTTLQPIPSFLDPALASFHPLYPSSQEAADTEQGISSKVMGGEHFENDGVVPLFSQWHPFPCNLTRCKHQSSGVTLDALQDDKPEPGVWHVDLVEEEANHVSF